MARRTRKIKRSRSRKVRRVSRKGGRKRRTKKRVSRKMKGGAASKTVGARKESEAERDRLARLARWNARPPEDPAWLRKEGLKRLEEAVSERKAAEADRDKAVAKNVELKKRLAENKANVELGRALRRDLQAEADQKK